jgi:hypothetical protein
MTRPEELSQDNWEALLDAGPAIALAVAAASGSGRQTEDELGAFVHAVSTGALEADQETLVGRLIADLHGRLAAGWRPDTSDPLMDGLQAARRAGAILAVGTQPAEAEAIRGWLLESARTVAASAREGGVLGVGAEDVSENETDTLRAIADALGIDAGAPPEP